MYPSLPPIYSGKMPGQALTNRCGFKLLANQGSDNYAPQFTGMGLASYR